MVPSETTNTRKGSDRFVLEMGWYNPFFASLVLALLVADVRSAFPDTHYEVDDLIAGGDKVVVRWRLLGTHQGDFRGTAPTGRPIELKGIAIYRVEGGKLMERWVV